MELFKLELRRRHATPKSFSGGCREHLFFSRTKNASGGQNKKVKVENPEQLNIILTQKVFYSKWYDLLIFFINFLNFNNINHK